MSKFTEWYDNNADQLNRKRKLRYKKDKKYRNKILSRNLKSKNKVARGIPSELELELSGKIYKNSIYPVSVLYDLINCTPQALNKWEKTEVIPETPLRDLAGRRVYTGELINLINEILSVKNKIDTQDNYKPIYYYCLNEKTHMVDDVKFYKKDGVIKILEDKGLNTNNLICGHYFTDSPYFTDNGINLFTEKMIDLFFAVCENACTEKMTVATAISLQQSIYKRWESCLIYELIKPIPIFKD